MKKNSFVAEVTFKGRYEGFKFRVFFFPNINQFSEVSL